MVSERLGGHEVDSKVAFDGASAIALRFACPTNLVLSDIQIPGRNGVDTEVAMHALSGFAPLPFIA
jgi:hypothetical protein